MKIKYIPPKSHSEKTEGLPWSR